MICLTEKNAQFRLGDMQSTTISPNAKKMEIIDYRLESEQTGEVAKAPKGKYDRYLGEYTHPAKSDAFEVFVQNESLTVDRQ